MTKHPLLPEDYKDSLTHAAILFALKPYETSGSRDVNNPQGRWNLSKAWKVAEELLPHTHWYCMEPSTHGSEMAEYIFPAYTEEEVERANTIIAGMVACQILEPRNRIAIRRIQHKKGGEMDLVISYSTAESLRALFPDMSVGKEASQKGGGKKTFTERFLRYVGFGRK